jgi:hypothetical protein
MRTTLLAALIVLTCAVAATAQPTPRVRPGPSPAEQQEILSYQLSMPVANKLLAALNALNQYVLSQPDWMAWVQQNMRDTREDQIRQLERDPKIMAILKQNGLTAREYAVGIVTLRQAIFKARDPNGPMAKNSIASAENLAFATANLKDLDARLRKGDEAFIPK